MRICSDRKHMARVQDKTRLNNTNKTENGSNYKKGTSQNPKTTQITNREHTPLTKVHPKLTKIICTSQTTPLTQRKNKKQQTRMERRTHKIIPTNKKGHH